MGSEKKPDDQRESAGVYCSAADLLDCLMAEYKYWRDDSNADMAIGAIGALANVIAFATDPEWRAPWHPMK